MTGYVLTIGPRIVAGPMELDEARKTAQGYLLSRGSDLSVIEVRPLVPGVVGGMGPAVCSLRRKRRGAKPIWTEHEGSPDPVRARLDALIDDYHNEQEKGAAR